MDGNDDQARSDTHESNAQFFCKSKILDCSHYIETLERQSSWAINGNVFDCSRKKLTLQPEKAHKNKPFKCLKVCATP